MNRTAIAKSAPQQQQQRTQVLTRAAAARKEAAKKPNARVPLAQVRSNATQSVAGGKKAVAAVSRKRTAVDSTVGVKKPTVSAVQKKPGAIRKAPSAAAVSSNTAKKPLPNIESMKKAAPSVDVLQQEESLPVAKKSRFEGWDDLDKDDDMDPLMVNEYVVEIFEYMKELEIETKPDPDYMSNQAELKWKMRGILVDWLVDVHSKFRLLPETLYLAINLIDRFLSLRVVSCAKLQLVGVAAMFIASKYEEICHPTIANFIFLADGGYTEEEVLKAERYLLQVLNFGLQYPNPMNFLRRCSKAENYNLQTRTLAKYLMEITLMDENFLRYVPSIIAAAGLYLARKMLNTGPWNVNLAHYSSYSEEELKPIVELMIGYLSKPIQFESIYNKYCAKRFMKSAIFVDNWIKKYRPPVKGAAQKRRDCGEFAGSSDFEDGYDSEDDVSQDKENDEEASD